MVHGVTREWGRSARNTFAHQLVLAPLLYGHRRQLWQRWRMAVIRHRTTAERNGVLDDDTGPNREGKVVRKKEQSGPVQDDCNTKDKNLFEGT